MMKNFGLHTFILASGSPRRRELIAHLGILPEIIPSDLEENAPKDNPAEMVKILSLQKAADIAARFHDGEIIIGADTCVAIKTPAGADIAASSRTDTTYEILGKPSSHEDAARMIRMYAGREHYVYTGVTLIRADGSDHPQTVSFAEKTAVHVSQMSAAEIKAYADTEEPMDKAGAYGIQGEFAPYIEGIEGDFYNVMGLPVSRLFRELKKFLEI